MKLEQYPTPETDAEARDEFDNLGFPYDSKIVDADFSRNLERRLAACHEALTRIVNENLTLDQVERIAEEALSQTKP